MKFFPTVPLKYNVNAQYHTFNMISEYFHRNQKVSEAFLYACDHDIKFK